MSEWKPIETAPKDGSAILAWWQDSSSHGIIAWCGCRGKWIARYDETPIPLAPGATYWMPLEPPPKPPRAE